MENKDTNQFNFSQLGLIALCAVLLIGTTYLKGGLSFHASNAAPDTGEKVLTYDEVKAQVEAENQPKLDQALAAIDSTGQDQVALLDPSQSDGSVLGTSTDPTQSIVGNPDEIFDKNILDQIKIGKQITTDQDSVKTYAENISIVENTYGALEVLSNLNTDDKNVLTDNAAKAKTLIAALSKISVPDELVEYHKYKMLYYLSISHLSEIMAGSRSDAEVDDTTQIFFAAMQKIQDIQQTMFQKYQVSF